MTSEAKESPGLTWQGPDLPRIPPGDYQALCVEWQGPDWVRSFRRWSLRLEFILLSGDGLVSAFFNMGNDEAKPHSGRMSRFYTAWVLANGEAPRNGQPMELEVFIDQSLIYTVRVADAAKNAKNATKPDALIYSRVTDILKIERP
jgi:hypothetical protein